MLCSSIAKGLTFTFFFCFWYIYIYCNIFIYTYFALGFEDFGLWVSLSWGFGVLVVSLVQRLGSLKSFPLIFLGKVTQSA